MTKKKKGQNDTLLLLEKNSSNVLADLPLTFAGPEAKKKKTKKQKTSPRSLNS